MPGLAELENQITASSASRARLLADTLELLENQGVDTSDESFSTLVSADISNEEAFRGALAASTVVIVIGTGGKQLGSSRVGNVASTVVIAIAKAGGRDMGGVGRATPGTAASTVVIAIASAGDRGSIGSARATPGTVASTVVIAIASAGQRGVLGAARSRVGSVASTVVIAIASAGERGFQGRMESTEGETPATAKLPSLENLSQISDGLRQLADLVDAGQLEIGQEVGVAFQQLVEHLSKDGDTTS